MQHYIHVCVWMCTLFTEIQACTCTYSVCRSDAPKEIGCEGRNGIGGLGQYGPAVTVCACMYVCMYHMNRYIPTCTHACLYMYVYMYMYIYMYVCVCMYM
jgi:hypothetical protein